MAEINKEAQTATWTESAASFCDFIRIPGRGIRFTCTSRNVAAKLGGSTVRMFGNNFITKAASVFDRMYYVDLKNAPSDLDDEEIYDNFQSLGLSPLITPTYQVGALMSRERTAWFNSPVCPPSLMVDASTAIREIQFRGFDRPVFFFRIRTVLFTLHRLRLLRGSQGTTV
ncbi:hypothetical protein PHMEG_00012121 [Phytophthora megakarya]|uniref:Uncharacterized protein n=1 Tax=Phytophthora megakarya TaxID=4795 RepID=A0A225W9I8_9STRA|nr:hypothetical protein PHMEG_00012121 [Phytophthora megakarya]